MYYTSSKPKSYTIRQKNNVTFWATSTHNYKQYYFWYSSIVHEQYVTIPINNITKNTMATKL
jgi:hypothetical protein